MRAALTLPPFTANFLLDILGINLFSIFYCHFSSVERHASIFTGTIQPTYWIFFSFSIVPLNLLPTFEPEQC